MANRKTNIAGLTQELRVQLRLADNPNMIVFTPLGGNGPVDIVTLDLKSKNYRKSESKSIPKDGYKRNMKGTFITRATTPEQKRLKVKIIYE